MASESFSGVQIGEFRRIYNEMSDAGEGGLLLEQFVPAVEACLRSAGLPAPSGDFLDDEFRRLSTTGTVSWQQFFQVLIHFNLNRHFGDLVPDPTPSPVALDTSPLTPESSISPSPGSTHQTSASPAPDSTHQVSTSPAPDSTHQTSTSPTPQPQQSGGSNEVVGSSRSRVGFIDDPEVVTVPSNVNNVFAADGDPTSSLSQTLRRGGARLGRAVGNFFGLTEESQHGTLEQMGWGRLGEMSAGETFTTTRRVSFRGIRSEENPPDYPGPPAIVPGARSFDPNELGDSSDEDEENRFITPAPPDYHEVVGSEPPQPVIAEVQVRRPPQPSPPAPLPSHTPQQQQQYPAPTQTQVAQRQPQQQRQQPAVRPAQPIQGDLIYDVEQAWAYYQRFVQAERNLRQRRHHQGAFEFFGSTDIHAVDPVPEVNSGVTRQGSLRRNRLGSTDGQPPVQLRRKKRKTKATKLQRQSTLVRHKVESLPTFFPWFVIAMTIGQLIGTIVLLSIRGIAAIDATPVRRNRTFPSLRSINENATDYVEYYLASNLWIGLRAKDLIAVGAKFTPCMRQDFSIRARNTRIFGDRRDNLGCCRNGNNIGTVYSLDECACSQGDNSCAQGGPEMSIAYSLGSCSNNGSSSSVGLPTFHPCCVSITGLCLVTSEEECDARNGNFFPDKDNCLEVNCLEDVCGFNGVNVGSESNTPYLPTANQFWRWILSLFIHLGVLHVVPVLAVQLYIGIKIERTIGWLRVGIIYFISGVGGNILSAIFIPYGVNAGASGAVLGLIGVLFVELFQFWQIVDNAIVELLKLLGFVVLLLVMGILPYVDNLANIGGLLFGLVAAIVFVPYITFGKLDTVRKRILLAICAPLLLVLFIVGLLIFYLIDVSSFCEGCAYINCIPFTEDFCPDEYRTPDPDIFSL